MFGTNEDNVDDASPEEFHLLFNRPRAATFSIDEAATNLLDVTNDIQQEKQLDGPAAGFGLRVFDASTSQAIRRSCPWTPAPSCDTENPTSFDLMYRRSDGSCNNFKEPNYGRATTPFQRIIPPKYSGDSLQMPRTSVKQNLDLPSARSISLKLAKQVKQVSTNQEDVNAVDSLQTVLVMQMGQFIDHDITHTPSHTTNCCNDDGTYPESYDADKCFPIRIEPNDPIWKNRKACMNLGRSLSAPGLKCSLEFRQQMNQITHWLDGSNIYGSSDEETAVLRSFFDGQLKITRQSSSRLGALPSCSENSNNHGNGRESAEVCENCKSCFFAGELFFYFIHHKTIMIPLLKVHNEFIVITTTCLNCLSSFFSKLSCSFPKK